MPSFDVVSEVDLHEVRNAVDQANREVGTRFDFQGSDAKFTLEEQLIRLKASSEFQLQPDDGHPAAAAVRELQGPATGPEGLLCERESRCGSCPPCGSGFIRESFLFSSLWGLEEKCIRG
ncbi:MAG: DUF520 family protein [Chromatiales bacterium]|nr:DUF520 family protein [Chromatiales bacterium]